MLKKNMDIRLRYRGGNNQIERMNKDKLNSLKKALLYSYQAATAILSDGREFRCLINPNKLSIELDNKILSIPFRALCLTSGQVEDTFIQEGEVIEWKENGSHWLVYLQRLEETAYFRADLRRCHSQISLSNGSHYWAYIRGPVEQTILWEQNKGNYFNKLNYTLLAYITKNEETLKYLHRFAKVKIDNNFWEVQAIDNISTPGIIEVALKEDFNNTPLNDINKMEKNTEDTIDCIETSKERIIGPEIVYPYEVYEYELKNSSLLEGTWELTNLSRKNIAKIVSSDNKKITINILTGRSASFTLNFIGLDRTISLPVKIQSL